VDELALKEYKITLITGKYRDYKEQRKIEYTEGDCFLSSSSE